MLSIRKGQFETNSSSCHVFIYDKKDNVEVPFVVELKTEEADDPLNVYFYDKYIWFKMDVERCPATLLDQTDMIGFLKDLYSIGVSTIICKDKYITSLIEMIKNGEELNGWGFIREPGDKELLKIILFSPNNIIDTVSDDYDMKKYVQKKYGKNKSFIAYRLT